MRALSVLFFAATLVLVSTWASAKERSLSALLIGIQSFTDRGLDLAYVHNDLDRLTRVLQELGFSVAGVKDDAILPGHTVRTEEDHRKAIEEKIRTWLDDADESATAILYFSTHGGLVDDKLYLATRNSNRENLDRTGIPVQWIRDEFERCKAACKILILDACHAGTAKGLGSEGVGKAVEVELRDRPGVTTIASCRGEEYSYLWDEKRQSLFTYWLCRALSGEVDGFNHRGLTSERHPVDGKITLDELMNYLKAIVPESALRLTPSGAMPPRQQHPLVLPGTTEDLCLYRKRQSIESATHAIAARLDCAIRERKVERIAVPELSAIEDDPKKRVLSAEFGILPITVAGRLHDSLAQRCDDQYTVLSDKMTREILTHAGATPNDLGGLRTMNLRIASELVDGLIDGRLTRGESAGEVIIECRLLKVTTGSELFVTSGVAYATQDELAELGFSIDTTGVDSFSDAQEEQIEQSQNPTETRQALMVFNATQRIEAGHPLSDPKYPYRIDIERLGSNNNFEPCPRKFVGNKCFVELRKGDRYRIRIENRAEEDVFLRLLVDGLNTLPQEPVDWDKGVSVEPAIDSEEIQPHPCVPVAQARPWFCPSGANDTIEGFCKVDLNYYGSFEVTDAPSSLAGRAGYTSQIGVITAVFYSLSESATRGMGVGTTEGSVVKRERRLYTGKGRPGKQLGIINIRYVDELPDGSE